MNSEKIYNSAELAQAAYGNLSVGATSSEANITELQASLGSNMTKKQADEFSLRYPEVVAQYNDTATSFSATVFEAVGGNLTLAIRGTAELIGSPNDLLPTDKDILFHGAGYDQIVAMYNWWQRVSSSAGEMVQQFGIEWYLDGDAVEADLLRYRQESVRER